MSEVLRLDRPKTLWVPSDVAISCEMPQLLQLLLEGQNPVASVMFQKEKNTGEKPTPTKLCSTEKKAPSGTSRPGDSSHPNVCETVPDCAQLCSTVRQSSKI